MAECSAPAARSSGSTAGNVQRKEATDGDVRFIRKITAVIVMLERSVYQGSPLYVSVCLSVRLSVTRVCHAYTVQDVEILFARYDRAMVLVSYR